MLTGYFTAGFLLCKIGEVAEYHNCIVYRSPFAFPTEQLCQNSLIEQSKILPKLFDFENTVYIKDVKCIEWLPTRESL